MQIFSNLFQNSQSQNMTITGMSMENLDSYAQRKGRESVKIRKSYFLHKKLLIVSLINFLHRIFFLNILLNFFELYSRSVKKVCLKVCGINLISETDNSIEFECNAK